MPHEKFCKLMRQINTRQRSRLLEIIHHLKTPERQTIIIIFDRTSWMWKNFCNLPYLRSL